MTNVKWLIAVDMANVLMGNVFVPEDTQDPTASKPTALIPAAQAMVFVWKELASVGRDGEAPLATLWTTRQDNVCLIAQVTETLIWRPKSAFVKDNGQAMTARKRDVIWIAALAVPASPDDAFVTPDGKEMFAQ